MKYRFIVFGIIAFIIFMILFYYFTKDNKLMWINKPHPSGKYGSSNPAERLSDVIAEFGPPDIIDVSRGGSAIWKKETLLERGHCWERVEILDEQIPHNDPAPHTDFLYIWYKLDVPKNKIDDIRSLSDSVTYDPLKKVIRARCHFTFASYATIVLAKRITTGEITLEEAKQQYGPLIMSGLKSSKTYDSTVQQKVIKELCIYREKI